MKTLSFIIILLFSITAAKAQKKPSFIEVDTATYRAYINKDWNRIIKVGNHALNNDLDYYYLRLRIGYALFMKEQYRLAIPHYKKALEFSSRDAIAFEFLYYCYKYSGRETDAILLTEQFPQALKDYLKLKKVKGISDISFYTTYGTGVNNTLIEDVSETIPTEVEGAQSLPNNFVNFNFRISHRINSKIKANHSVNLLYVDYFVYENDLTDITTTESQIVRQFNYNLNIDISPRIGLSITPIFNSVNYRIPYYTETTFGFGGNTQQTVNYTNYHDFVIGLKASQQIGIFKLSLAATNSNLNFSKQNTGAASLAVYPFGNLNLYYAANVYYHMQSNNDIKLNQFIQSHEIGFKVMKNLWIEANMMLGEFTNFYDSFAGITYNGLEKYKRSMGVNVIIPLNKSGISIFAAYRNNSSESIYVSTDNLLDTYNNKPYTYQIITGGISWKL